MSEQNNAGAVNEIPLEIDPQGLRVAGTEPYSQPIGELEEGEGSPIEWFPNEPLVIDVSRYQGTINFAQLKQNQPPNKVEAVIARATMGASFSDPTFRHNLDGAMEHIGVAGAYLVLHPGTDPRSQVDHFLRFTGGNYGNLPVALDVELDLGQSKAVITDAIVETLRYLRQATGKVPIIYTANWFWGPNVYHTSSLWEPYKNRLWVAHYWHKPFVPTLPEPWRSWGGDGHLVHQYSETGRLDGIPTENRVDLNRFNGDITLLHQIAGLIDVDDDNPDAADDTQLLTFDERLRQLESRVKRLEEQ